jgi:hypothetical protein
VSPYWAPRHFLNYTKDCLLSSGQIIKKKFYEAKARIFFPTLGGQIIHQRKQVSTCIILVLKEFKFLAFLPCKEIISCMLYLEDYQLQWILITDDRDFRPQTCTNGLVFKECKHIKNIFEDVYFTKNSFHITLNKKKMKIKGLLKIEMLLTFECTVPMIADHEISSPT